MAACATRQAATPPPAPTAQQILANASAEDFTCTHADATDVSFSGFAAAPESFVDKCVHLKGLATFRYLYKDGAAIESLKGAVTPTTIGLYWKDEAGMKKLAAGAQFVEIVGRIRHCDARLKLDRAAGVTDVGACQGVSVAIFVSQVHVFPTAMD